MNIYGFDIERRAVSDQPSSVNSWQKVCFVNGNGTSNVQHSYSFSDNVTESGTYAYRLKQIDNGGVYKYSQETEVTIEVPKVFTLNQNYPNPFNPSTKISFSVAQTEYTKLSVYNLLGKQVAVLFDGLAEGNKEFIVTFDGSLFASGVYFYKMQTPTRTDVRRMILMK